MENLIKTLFDENYVALCNYAKVIVKDKHLAEDIVQSVFIQLWENNKITNLEHPESFLLTCVRNKCIDLKRSPHHQKVQYMEDLPEAAANEERSLKEEDILPMLHYFAASLPPKTKQVFLMSRTNLMTYKQIAIQLGISVKTVENQMGTALKRLRKLLQNHHYLPLLIFYLQ